MKIQGNLSDYEINTELGDGPDTLSIVTSQGVPWGRMKKTPLQRQNNPALQHTVTSVCQCVGF